jgi:hypothetical protein
MLPISIQLYKCTVSALASCCRFVLCYVLANPFTCWHVQSTTLKLFVKCRSSSNPRAVIENFCECCTFTVLSHSNAIVRIR